VYARFEVAPQPQNEAVIPLRNIEEQRMELEELKRTELKDNREQEIRKTIINVLSENNMTLDKLETRKFRFMLEN